MIRVTILGHLTVWLLLQSDSHLLLLPQLLLLLLTSLLLLNVSPAHFFVVRINPVLGQFGVPLAVVLLHLDRVRLVWWLRVKSLTCLLSTSRTRSVFEGLLGVSIGYILERQQD